MESVISQVPEVYRDIYINHWNTIKYSFKRGVIKDVYHFPIANYNQGDITNLLTTVRACTTGKFKINVSFGFIIKNRITEELRFYHPSNNTLLFELPMLIANGSDFNNLVDRVEHQDALEYARLQRPSTSWIVEKIICVKFDVFRLQ